MATPGTGSAPPPAPPAPPRQPAAAPRPDEPTVGRIDAPRPASADPAGATTRWFAQPFRGAAWDSGKMPQPVHGNLVTAYVHVQGFYEALGKTLLAARADLADFIYIAGWELDLETIVVFSPAKRRLRELLTNAIKGKVDVRVLLDNTANRKANQNTIDEIVKMGGGGALDPFHLGTGSQHQKFVVARTGEGVVGYCGGSDIANHRLGRVGYDGPPITDEQIKANGGLLELVTAPWHDVQVKVQGAAAADMWQSFVQRFEQCATAPLHAPIAMGVPVPRVASGATSLWKPDAKDAQPGSWPLDVQVLRTYPNRTGSHVADVITEGEQRRGYDFAPKGEMGYYAALVRALEQTAETIYLEDQYLVQTVAMGSHPPITEALARTVNKSSFKRLIIAIAGTGTVFGELGQAASRRKDFVNQIGNPSKVKAYVYGGDKNSPYWFHSKTWIFDDTFAIVGSANCNRRSYSCDSELGVAVGDPRVGQKYNFAKRLRMDLWLKHLNTGPLGKPAPPQYGDADVEGFVEAADKLWPKCPLMHDPGLAADNTADLPASKLTNFYNSWSGTKLLVDRVADTREKLWGFVDPDGS